MRAKTEARKRKTVEVAQRSGKLLGYARVSTTDQDLTVQRKALRRAVANRRRRRR
jgi:Resolvase, N terminal domain